MLLPGHALSQRSGGPYTQQGCNSHLTCSTQTLPQQLSAYTRAHSSGALNVVSYPSAHSLHQTDPPCHSNECSPLAEHDRVSLRSKRARRRMLGRLQVGCMRAAT